MTGWRIRRSRAEDARRDENAPVRDLELAVDGTVRCNRGLEPSGEVYRADAHGIICVAAISSQHSIRWTIVQHAGVLRLPDIRPTGLLSNDFCEEFFKEEKVAIAPGSAFGESARFCMY